MKKIAIDLTSLDDNFSGIERFALSISKTLIEADKRNRYILIFKNSIHSEFKDISRNVTCKIIHCRYKLLCYQILLPLLLYKIQADTYLFLAYPSPLLFFSRKSLSTIHDLSCWDCRGCNTKKMELYFKILYKKVSLFEKAAITVSKFSKERISNILKIKAECIQVIYNGISHKMDANQPNRNEFTKDVSNKYNLPNKYILCLSTIEPRKNIRLLISAYAELLASSQIEHKLVLVGRKGWLTDDIIGDLPKKITDNIVFTGFVDDDDLPYIYRGADLFVFPSLYEGFGIPPIEAMANRVRVLSSDSSCLPEILGRYAMYFKNNDIKDLKSKMIECLEEDNNDLVISEAYEYIKRFNWRESAGKLLKILNDGM